MKDDKVNKDDADYKQAINELKIRKRTLEDQVKRKTFFY
jgi:hypothetical protein